ncbi:aminotransferase class V-fold PLP-dependent enzyme [Thermodesulfobacteriota bacterium]
MRKIKSTYLKYRSQFPITEKYTFMNHAAISAIPKRTADAVSSFYKDCSLRSSINYPKWMKRIDDVRRLVASLINSQPGEIAFTGNTSEGISLVASGFKWNKGDSILVSRPDFPSNIYPWLNLESSGVVVKFVDRKAGRLESEDFSRALDKKTRMIAVSSVDFLTGFRIDLEALGELCRRKGIFLCVDAIQSLGVIPIDVKQSGIHFMASGGHKWLLGPMGCGFLYVSDDVGSEIRSNCIGWKSVVNQDEFFKIDFNLKPNALRFEAGTMNVAGIYALGVSLELLMGVGIGNIYERVLALNKKLYSGLKERGLSVITPMSKDERSGIISFVPSSDSERLHKYLTKKNIIVSLRKGVVRFSPHFYNTEHEIENFLSTLDKFK